MVKKNESALIYEIKITLKDVKPPIWRRVQVRSDITLAKLHHVIQITMGWTDSHLHAFTIDGQSYSASGMLENDVEEGEIDEGHVPLDKVAVPKSRFIYLYDFGDDWSHEIKVEKVVELQTGAKTPHCVAGKGACPPEDCGGPWGYAEMLKKLAGPPCEERSELLEWIDDDFDPKQFDLQEVNAMLKNLQK